MSARGGAGDGICILSFDSGGPGTYSQLLILKEYMSRLAIDLDVSQEELYPADYFDLMGGVGFGGLASILLGHLRMNISQAIDALLDVAFAVFPEGSQPTLDADGNGNKLRIAIEDILQARQIPLNTRINEPNRPQTGCKVVLYAATSANIGHPHALRTYPHRGSSLNPTILEAICATISIPSLFSPVKIGPRRTQQSFIGGPVGAHNPTRELLQEASKVFGDDTRVAQIISIGCGACHILSLEESKDEAGGGGLQKKMAADCHIVTKDLSMRLFNVEAYLRLDVQHGMDTIEFDDWSVLGDIETHTTRYIETAAVAKVMEVSLQSLRSKVGTIALGRLSQSSSIKVAAKSAPAVSTHFVVRMKPLETMVHHLVTVPSLRQKILPITGMGGCGKTQMVSYFLQTYPSLYTHVVFVDAGSSFSIQSDLQTWARTRGNGHEQDVWEDGIRILSTLPQDERSALVLDNADDPGVKLAPFIPKNVNVTVIITSRNRDVGTLSTTHHLELGEMEPGEAFATLLQAARRELPLSDEETKSAYTLMKELGYLALALVQAGTYCYQLSSYHGDVWQPYTFTQYLSLFYAHRDTLMKEGQPSPLDSYERGVYTTLDLSYQMLLPVDREFLHFLSFFHHADIPLAAFATAANGHFTDSVTYLPRAEAQQKVISHLNGLLCVEGNWSALQVQGTIRTLRAFSLVSTSSINESIFLQLHPLIQAWSRDTVASSQHYRAMVIQILTSCSGTNDFSLSRYMLPHVLDTLNQSKERDLHVNDLMAAGEILGDQGQYRKATGLFETALKEMTICDYQNTEMTQVANVALAKSYWNEGRWTEAENLGVEVLGQQRRILGLEHPDTITAASNLALTYSHQGRQSEAEKLQVEALAQRTRVLGPEHQDTMTAASNLAMTYSEQGRHSKAEKLQVEVLEQWRRILGLEHPVTTTAASNLAMSYSHQGRHDEAGKLQVEVLERRRRVQGLEHPDTITAASNLAVTYLHQGRYSEAEKLQVEVLEQRRRVLGLEHPATITAASNLAATYSHQGRHGESGKLQVEVLEQRRKAQGLEHPDTITAASNLAMTYSHQGGYSEAEKLQVEVLEQRRRVLGLEHPATITAASNLAATYSHQGRHSESGELQVEVLEQRRRVLGLEHPDTITAASNLALTYSHQGRHSEAEKLQVEVLEQRRRVLGREHPDTITAASNLALTYSHQGRHSEAEKLQVEVLEQRRRVQGLEHPDTITAASNLATTYPYQGRYSEAEKLQVYVLEELRKILGLEHPSTITAASNLAMTYSYQGRHSEAVKLQVEVLEQRRRVLGPEHLDTITAVSNLALTYSHQGKHSEAEKLQVNVLGDFRRVLGLEHPSTITTASNLAATYSYQCRHSEAEKLEVEVLEQRRSVLGLEHPDTITAASHLAATYGAQNRWEEDADLLEFSVKLGLKVLGHQHPGTQGYIRDLAFVYGKMGKEKEAEETKKLLIL